MQHDNRPPAKPQQEAALPEASNGKATNGECKKERTTPADTNGSVVQKRPTGPREHRRPREPGTKRVDRQMDGATSGVAQKPREDNNNGGDRTTTAIEEDAGTELK